LTFYLGSVHAGTTRTKKYIVSVKKKKQHQNKEAGQKEIEKDKQRSKGFTGIMKTI